MKKIIAIFLTITSMFSFFILFNNEKIQQRNEMEKAEQNLKYRYNIIIPIKIDSKDTNETLKVLENILDKYNASIYYKRLSKEENEQKAYVYINDTEYLSNFELKSGRKLEKSDMNSTNFLSSREVEDSNEVGVLSTFCEENVFEIHTLKEMIEKGYSLSGECCISFGNSDSKNVNKFIEDLENELNIKGISIQDKSNGDINIKDNQWIIIAILYFITMMLVLYYLLKSYKKIGIEKLMGFSSLKIYLDRILTLAKMFVIISLITNIVMVLYKFRNINSYVKKFLIELACVNATEFIIFIIICSVPFIYIDKIQITNMLKNKKLTTEIMLFNFFVKVILICSLVMVVNQGINNFDRIRNVFTESFKQWEDVKDYVGIPSIINTNMEELSDQNYLKNQKELYKYFSEQGGILADFSEYSPGTREMRKSETNFDYERDNVTVNPNYLDKYPVYDVDGNRISISEDDSNYILLIPDKFKDNEKEILDLFNKWKEAGLCAKSAEQPNEIIWIKSNQKLFSMAIDINSGDGNNVTDPIIHVLTNNNANISNYDTILGITGLPFKIKVTDYENPGESIMPILKEYGYDKNVNKISSINEQVASESDTVMKTIQFLAMSIIVILICIVIVILQNIYNYFDKYSKKIAIKKLNGFKLRDKYKGYFYLIILSWAMVFIIHLVLKRVPLNINCYLVLSGVVVEILISLLVLVFIDKKKVSKVIKGEI